MKYTFVNNNYDKRIHLEGKLLETPDDYEKDYLIYDDSGDLASRLSAKHWSYIGEKNVE